MEKHQIIKKIEEIVSANGYIPIDIAFRGDHHLTIIEIYIDSEKGITTVDCAQVSRAINNELEVLNLVESNYRLDVSSPGVDRPIKFLVQYIKHINRKFEINYTDDEEEKKITGKLVRIEEDNLFFAEKNSEYKINFNKITKAKVLISF
jgi:ribosome maturation factor RimP